MTAPLPNDRTQTWVLKVIGEEYIRMSRVMWQTWESVPLIGQEVPRIGLNLYPFTGYGDVSIWFFYPLVLGISRDHHFMFPIISSWDFLWLNWITLASDSWWEIHINITFNLHLILKVKYFTILSWHLWPLMFIRTSPP